MKIGDHVKVHLPGRYCETDGQLIWVGWWLSEWADMKMDMLLFGTGIVRCEGTAIEHVPLQSTQAAELIKQVDNQQG